MQIRDIKVIFVEHKLIDLQTGAAFFRFILQLTCRGGVYTFSITMPQNILNWVLRCQIHTNDVRFKVRRRRGTDTARKRQSDSTMRH